MVEPEDGEDTSQDAADLVEFEVRLPVAKTTTTAAQEPAHAAQDLPDGANLEPVPKANEVAPVQDEQARDEVEAGAPIPRSRLAIQIPAPNKEVQVQKQVPEVAKPVAKPAANPVAKPAAKPVAKPAAKPEVVKPVVIPVAKPAAKPEVVKPVLATSDKKANTSAAKVTRAKSTDDDDNFMIESDNVDDNLYSSESDSTTTSGSTETPSEEPLAKAKQPIKPAPPQPKLKFSSSSSSNDPGPPVQTKPDYLADKPGPGAKPDNVAKPVVKIESDSDSPPARRPGGPMGLANNFSPQGAVEDLDISGPENELDDDDFWN